MLLKRTFIFKLSNVKAFTKLAEFQLITRQNCRPSFQKLLLKPVIIKFVVLDPFGYGSRWQARSERWGRWGPGPTTNSPGPTTKAPAPPPSRAPPPKFF